MSKLYPYITGGFNYSVLFTVYLLTNHCTQPSITLSASFAEVIIIWICSAHSVPECNTVKLQKDATFTNIAVLIAVVCIGLNIGVRRCALRIQISVVPHDYP